MKKEAGLAHLVRPWSLTLREYLINNMALDVQQVILAEFLPCFNHKGTFGKKSIFSRHWEIEPFLSLKHIRLTRV